MDSAQIDNLGVKGLKYAIFLQNKPLNKKTEQTH